jgi:benzoyl-CoA reductase/2-hydroxyglutaryl-CoA dehydratase subunit BcrC/BadD/HgdB
MEENFGAMVVTQSLPATATLEPIDTSSLDTMLEGVAWQGLDMTMSLMRLASDKFVGNMLEAYNHYDCECMFVTQHVGCNSVCGSRGLIKQMCRNNDIPVLFLEFDYNDDRVLTIEQMRAQISEFFETVMA